MFRYNPGIPLSSNPPPRLQKYSNPNPHLPFSPRTFSLTSDSGFKIPEHIFLNRVGGYDSSCVFGLFDTWRWLYSVQLFSNVLNSIRLVIYTLISKFKDLEDKFCNNNADRRMSTKRQRPSGDSLQCYI